MVTFDISSDIDAAIRGVGDFFRRQIPFATASAINNTIFDVRRDIIESTWPKSFTVRNQALPRRLFKVSKRATKADLKALLSQDLDRRWVERQATGGTKTGSTGGRVAIPTTPDAMRTSTGRIKAALKPGRLNGKPGIVAINRGAKTFIIQRGKRTNKLLYSVVASAQIKARFTFDQDAEKATMRVFPGYWRLAMNAAIAKSRFTSR